MLARPAILLPLLLLIVATAALAGCGGNDVAYEEVKLPPPTLTIPKDTGTTAASKDATPTATPSVTPTATADDGAAAGGGTADGTTSGGTTDDSGTTGGAQPTQTAAPAGGNTGGTTDEGLDQFCADNPGACDGGTQSP